MNPYQQYQQTKVATASPEALVLMLYDGAMKFAGQARTAIEADSIEAAHNALVRCQDIVWELDNSLDMSCGEISENLRNLYGYINERLVEANWKKEVAPLDEAVQVLRSMREMWAEVISEWAKSKKAEATAQAAGAHAAG